MVTDGQLEIFTYFEGNEFIIEYLDIGCILNYRSFLLEDNVCIYARCTMQTVISEITKEKLESIIQTTKTMSNQLLRYQNQLLQSNKNFPLDYLILSEEKQ